MMQICPVKLQWSGAVPAAQYAGVGWKQTGTFSPTGKAPKRVAGPASPRLRKGGKAATALK
jgi:hypothetical protein